MKYPKISSLVPEKEHFDETAINGEGVWLSIAHVNLLEKSIADSEIALAAKDATIKDIDEANEKLTTDLAVEKTANEKLIADNAAQAAGITELESKIVALGKKPSGKGTSLSTTKDETVESVVAPAYLDDSAPENEWFDKQIKYR